MKVGIIVAVWNHCDITVNFIHDLYMYTDVAQFELIVIDNGSIDSTQRFLKSLDYKNLHIIRNGHNFGVPLSWNQGIKYALSLRDIKYLLIINNDVRIYDSSWLLRFIDAIKDEKKIIGPQYVTVNDAARVDNQQVPYISGWCMFMPASAIDDVGYFDPQYTPCFYEDVDFSFRAEYMGYKLEEIQGLPIEHLYGKTVLDGRLEIGAIHLKNKPYFDEKVRHYRSQPEIIFWCPGNYMFHGEDFEGIGVGGSEAALICLSRELVKLGYKVIIYNDDLRRKLDGKVEYRMIQSQKAKFETDLFILFRASHYMLNQVEAKAKWFWSTDQYTTRDWNEKIIPYVSKFICISPYHAEYVQANYQVDPNIIWVEPLGVVEKDYRILPEKIPNKMIYCSVPHRGLGNLFSAWPEIKSRIPDASLVVTADYRLWGSQDPDNRKYIQMLDGLKDVAALWRVPRKDLVFHQLTSELMTFPANYEENYCLSALECMAAGCVPITSKMGALDTTVGDGCGIKLDGHPDDPGFMKNFIDSAYLLSSDIGLRKKMMYHGRTRALEQFSWHSIALDWHEEIQKV